MDVLTAIEKRRSIKHFDSSHHITEDEVNTLFAAAMLSPTTFNLQHWRFLRIVDRETREQIRAVSWMQPQITEAALFLIICADLKAWKKQPKRYWRNVPLDVREGIVEAIGMYYRDREQIQRDEAMRSCGIVAQTLMLAAKAMGYDSSPMDLSDLDEVASIIRLPPDHVIGMFLAIGKAVSEPWPRAGQLPLEEVVLLNRF